MPPGCWRSSTRWQMSDFLAAMTAASHVRADAVRQRLGEAELGSRASTARPALPLRLSDEGFDLIAEAKLASPSEGRLASDGDDAETVARLASTMSGSGAVAISVLTEPSRFDGDIIHLEAVASSVGLPVMRKDFLVDPIQVIEARAAGASGVLLIARITHPELLVEMTDLALSLGMFVLVELFEEGDLEAASGVFDRSVLIGVNSRDLTTLEVDPDRHERMAALLPDHVPLVAESGIVDAADAARVARLGYRLALVGSRLVSSGDPSGLASEMIRAGRQVIGIREAL